MAIYSRDNPALFERALQSILNQVLPDTVDLRLYIGIDGPIGNNLQQVIDKNASRIYRIVQSKVNSGLAVTLNSLISVRQDEEFFFRMDADDVSLQNRFIRQIAYFDLHSQLDIIGTDIIEVDDVLHTKRIVSFCRGPNHARELIAKRVPVAHPTVCFRSRVFDKIAGYPERRGNEDIAMWFECMRCGFLFDNVPEPLLLFTVSPDFWARRGYDKSISEFFCYIRGIWMLYGITWYYIYPIVRLALRLSPAFISKWLYRTSVRNRLR